MNQREKEILKLEEDFRDTLENELIKQQKENKKIEIKDIKLVGEAVWKDKINGKSVSENVFIVEKETKEIDENGNERVIETKNYYLGDKCIAATIGDNQLIYREIFKTSESDKMNAVNDLLSKVSEKDIDNNSLNRLQRKEMAEILTAYLGQKVTEEEVEKKLEELSESEIEELKDEQEDRKDKDENNLSKKQTEKIKVNGIQKADLNKLVDGKETLGKRLDLEQYDSIYVVYSDKVDEITSGAKKNNTTYSLVGMTKNGESKVLNDEFEMDQTVGNSASREQTKIRANSTATRDNKDISVYTRKSNGASIGCENSQGDINMFLYQKTMEENENVGIQIETSETPVIPIETREIMNRNRGIYQKEKVQDEIQEHTEKGCAPDNVKDFDGNEETTTHNHSSENMLNDYVIEIFNYENEDGEEKIKEVFTEDEVKDKLLRELKENKDRLSVQQIVENVKEEMNQDAEVFSREHKL
ncbi:MAG: hypothetical protein IJE05_02290 [Clostridia bacterium]|nr:hypothetical protein [Clostridia bacterium]